MSTTLSHRHLQALGITAWVRRCSPAAQSAAVPVADRSAILRLNRPQTAVGTIIVEWSDGEMGLQADDPGGALLTGILAAMQLRCDDFLVLQLAPENGPPDPAALPLSGSVVLCFVEHWRPPSGHCMDRHWVPLPSLGQMLSERRYKRLAWQQLEPWAKQLQ